MKLKTLALSVFAATSAVAIGTVVAQDKPAMDHSKMDHGSMPMGAPDSPAAKAFIAANAKMHKDMTMTFTGDADVDFIKGMLPHHVGAVDMAQIVLQYGKDPEVKKLAEEIIKAQNTEIDFMKGWLAKKAK